MHQTTSNKNTNGSAALTNAAERPDRTQLSVYQQPASGSHQAVSTVAGNSNVPVTLDSILSRDGDLVALVAEVARESGASGRVTETVEIIYDE